MTKKRGVRVHLHVPKELFKRLQAEADLQGVGIEKVIKGRIRRREDNYYRMEPVELTIHMEDEDD